MKLRSIVILAALFLFFGATVNAQNTQKEQKIEKLTTVSGVVFDWNGAVIVNAEVIMTDENGKSVQTITDSEGRYKLSLSPSVYRIEATANGFCAYKQEKYRVIDSTFGKMSFDFVLDVALNVEEYLKCNKKQKNKSKKNEKNKPIIIK